MTMNKMFGRSEMSGIGLAYAMLVGLFCESASMPSVRATLCFIDSSPYRRSLESAILYSQSYWWCKKPVSAAPESSRSSENCSLALEHVRLVTELLVIVALDRGQTECEMPARDESRPRNS